MASIDQQFVEYIVKTLVNNPEKVVVERTIDERGVLLSLTVDPEDVGRVIGRRGVTAQAIRVLLRALGTKQDARYNLKIVNSDDDESRSKTSESSRPAEDNDDMKVTETEEDADVARDDDENETDSDEEESSDLAEKTRAELADLDDLDI